VVREILAGFSWPRAFASAGEPISIFRQAAPFGAQSKEVEFRCVRTTEGFIAAMAAEARVSEARTDDLLLDVFSAHIRERRAISRHLHGALTQDLVALSLSLSGMRDEGSRDFSEAIAHVERCCRGVRALSYILAPPSFLDSNLMETISWYAGVLRSDAGVDFAIEADALPADPPEEIKSLFFAALQQMAAAAIWHPEGARMRVRLKARARAFSMRVDCDCQPSEPVAESPLIRERARALGGWTRLTTKRKEATLEISVPWSPAR
jgi:signal transduction histidine kinase